MGAMTEHRVLKPYNVEVSLPAGRDEAWDALTQPPVLHQWFGWDYGGLDAEIQQIFVTEATLMAPEQMGWADGSFLEVVGGDDRSLVRAVREGPAPGDPDRYDAIEEGWRTFLAQLRFYFQRRPAGARRTVYLTGETTPRQAMSLVDGEWTEVGHRIAWTVDPDGHLVVVGSHVPLTEKVAARTEITVSTYGLADAAFTTCRDGWAKRWAPLADGANVTVAGDPDPTR
jgi:uncharacterized protein YndB with AHSA1/START domain